MIKEIICQGSFTKNNFEPLTIPIPAGIHSQAFNKGDLISNGRFKGEIEKEGYLLFSGSFDSVLGFIESKKLIFLDPSAELSLTILVKWEERCNFEFTTKELQRLAQLGITVGISCYEGN